MEPGCTYFCKILDPYLVPTPLFEFQWQCLYYVVGNLNFMTQALNQRSLQSHCCYSQYRESHFTWNPMTHRGGVYLLSRATVWRTVLEKLVLNGFLMGIEHKVLCIFCKCIGHNSVKIFIIWTSSQNRKGIMGVVRTTEWGESDGRRRLVVVGASPGEMWISLLRQ